MMAKNAEAREKIVQCLQLMANHQIEAPHVGTMIYHFTNPCKESKENYFEFIELYANEEVFWKHSKKKSEIAKAYFDAFLPSNCVQNDFSVIGGGTNGETLPNSVKQCLNAFKANYCSIDAGYVIHDDYGSCLDIQDDSKLLIKFTIHIDEKKRNNGKINKNFSQFI